MTSKCRMQAAVVAVAVAVVFLLAGPAMARTPKYIWKTGTLAPKNVGYANQVQSILIPALERISDGELTLKVYWGGVMGDDEQHLKKMHVGQLQAAGLSGQGTFMMTSKIAVLGLPFLFNDFDEVDYLKTKMLGRFDGIVEEEGFKLLLWLDQDFDQIYSAKRPIVKVEDFRKARFVTWFGPLEGRLLELLGTTPVPLGVAEIPSSLRSGVCDSMIAPAIWVVGTQLYSTFRYVNPVKIRYVPAFAVCTTAAWAEIPESFHEKIYAGRAEWANQFTSESRVDAEKCVKAMVRYGVVEKTSTPEQLDAIRERSLPLWDMLAGELYPRELLEEIKGHLADYRKTKP